MRKIFKAIRSFNPLNKILRISLKGIRNIINRMIDHWPVHGIVNLTFDKIQFKMYSKGDDHIVNLLYYTKNYYEQSDLHFFLKLAEKSNTILDIGANTGIYTILLNKVNPSATIYSFEPNPVNIVRLKKNIQVNNTRNKIIGKAVGDKLASISFAVPSGNSVSDTSSVDIEFSKNTYEGQINWKSIEVEQITLDIFAEEEGVKEVNLLKIDVEGYEQSVFQGATGFFARFSPIIQCEILLDDKKKKFFEDFIRQNGYTAYLILNDGLLRTDGEMQYNPGSLNYLFAKRKTFSQFTPFSKIEILTNELTGE